MRYFITGATGFIGGHVARMLLAEGHEVIALVRDPARGRELAARGATLHRGDITDRASMRPAMQGVDGVFHLAGIYQIGVRDRRGMAAANIDGTRNVLDLMRKLAIPKGVYTSSVGVFSNTGGRVPDESHYYAGPFTSTYERTKWIAHYEIARPMMRDGLPLVIVMPGVVYGPGDRSLVHLLMTWYLRGWLKAAPRGVAYAWTHVEDTARGHLLAMERGTPGESYILTGEAAGLDEVLALGQELYGIRAPRLYISPRVMRLLAGVLGVIERVVPLRGVFSAEGLRTFAGVTYLGSNAKACRELGFAPRPLREGLLEMADYELAQMGRTPPVARHERL